MLEARVQIPAVPRFFNLSFFSFPFFSSFYLSLSVINLGMVNDLMMSLF